MAAEQAIEDRAFKMQQLDTQLAADAAYERAVFAEHLFEAEHGMPRHEYERLRQAQADEWPERDPSAPYGSDRNPAAMIGGQVLDPRPVTRSLPGLAADHIEALDRSRHLDAAFGEYMAAEVRRFDAARAGGRGGY
jgi:hypothetical protein